VIVRHRGDCGSRLSRGAPGIYLIDLRAVQRIRGHESLQSTEMYLKSFTDRDVSTASGRPRRKEREEGNGMPRSKTQAVLSLIEECRNILEEIHPASVRAVCYQLFVRELLESMSKNCTNRISRHLVYARERNIVPWDWIVDETREAERVNAWKNPASFVRTVKRSYRRDHWAYQPVLVEIISEKSTVKGTLAPVLEEYGVTFRPWHGYVSATKAHELAGEIRTSQQPMILLYMGDWDPSGLDMSERDAPERIVEYGSGDGFSWRRIALTEELIRRHDLPGFDVESKQKDGRYKWYRGRHGARAWELDALSPNVLRAVVEAEIQRYINWDAWEQSRLVEQAETDSLQHILDRWTQKA
jgi:hypothetical protein